MSEYCDLIRYVLPKSPTNVYPSCATPQSGADIPSIFSGCIIYALIHQNIFSQRWNDIQLAVTATPPAQIHTSLNSPQPIASTTTTQQLYGPHVLSQASKADLSPATTRRSVTLAMTTHTLGEIRHVLTTTLSSPLSTKVYIYHPAFPRTVNHLHSSYKTDMIRY